MGYATSGKVVLIILDGFGMRKERRGNAAQLARMPFYDSLKKYPHSILKAGGESDGLEKGTIGNSEVGHLNIGAGRIVYQSSMRITNAIKNGEFFRNKKLLNSILTAKKKNGILHLVGLISDKGVHSQLKHLFSLLEMAKRNNVTAYVHAITDGRDTAPKTALKYAAMVERLAGKKNGAIATVCGRYYAMDRDHHWERNKKAFDAMARGIGERKKSAADAIRDSYARGKTDEFIEPAIIGDYSGMKKGDQVITFNFRPDRMRQLCSLFEREKISVLTMVKYDSRLRSGFAFPPLKARNCLGEILARNRIRQLRLAESEKYAHVTYFFNGLVEKPLKGEDRIVLPSPKVATFDLTPEMKAREITEILVQRMKEGKHGAIIVNFANPDMLGHTGKIRETVKALEAIDECLEKIVKSRTDETIIITADHGNCEEMEGPHTTSHTLNPVPFIIVSDRKLKARNGIHADVAPTILQIMGLSKPKEMEGKSLITGMGKKK